MNGMRREATSVLHPSGPGVTSADGSAQAARGARPATSTAATGSALRLADAATCPSTDVAVHAPPAPDSAAAFLDGLTPHERLVLMLHFGDSLTLDEVSAVLDLPGEILASIVEALRTRAGTLLAARAT